MVQHRKIDLYRFYPILLHLIIFNSPILLFAFLLLFFSILLVFI
jgi:hypothetical protein